MILFFQFWKIEMEFVESLHVTNLGQWQYTYFFAFDVVGPLFQGGAPPHAFPPTRPASFVCTADFGPIAVLYSDAIVLELILTKLLTSKPNATQVIWEMFNMDFCLSSLLVLPKGFLPMAPSFSLAWPLVLVSLVPEPALQLARLPLPPYGFWLWKTLAWNN